MAVIRKSVVFALCLAACGGDPLDEPDDIAGWAVSASALGAFAEFYEPLAFADGNLPLADTDCPATDDDGTTVTMVGDGCEDSTGATWLGSATVVRGDDGSRTVELADYDKAEDLGFSATVTGTMEVVQLAENEHSFEIDAHQEGGIDKDVTYSGTVEGGYTGRTVWNGSGTIARDGLVIDSGTIEATTVDQVRDNDVCGGEGISGTTTMVSEAHTVVIEYDGETDCDGDESARWSRDGEDQGLVAGVTCSLAGGGPGTWVSVLAIALAVGVASRRRRK